MSVQLAVVQVAGGWRVIGRDFKSRVFDFRVDAVELLLATARGYAEVEPEVTMLVHEAGRLVRIDQTGARLDADDLIPPQHPI